MSNLRYDGFDAERSEKYAILVWRFTKYPGAMLEHELLLQFDPRHPTVSWWVINKNNNSHRRYSPEDFVLLLPEGERARAMAESIRRRGKP